MKPDIRSARELGFAGYTKYIASKCSICGETRWVQVNQLRSGRQQRCRPCADLLRTVVRGDKVPNWRGGRYRNARGYVMVRSDEFPTMLHPNGYVLEHRLVMARKLGRPLTRKEIVHHRNGIKSDNAIENLQLMEQAQHISEHSKVVKRIAELEEELAALRAQLAGDT